MNPARLVFPAIRWHADTGFGHERESIRVALTAGVGGFIIFGGTREAVTTLTTELRRGVPHPLLIGADLERGAGQQFAGCSELPPPRALASLGDPAVIESAGRLTALEARAVGVDWIYAPVADLDVEPDNPIVQTRSFGDDPVAVARAVSSWIMGCQAGGGLACAKHFPGHGRTRHDSHDRLPSVAAAAATLARDDVEPFRAAIRAGVGSVMTAHVAFPALDPTGLPATRSPAILSLLRHELGFSGLVVSDALIMEGARGGGSAEAAAVDAVAAGVDCLLYPPDPAETIRALELARGEPRFEERLTQSLGRIAAAAVSASQREPAAHTALPIPSHEIADRLVTGAQPAGSFALRAPLDLIVIDDDLDGAYPPSPSNWMARALADAGIALGAGGSRLVLVFAEPRASKGRGGLGPASRAKLADVGPTADLIVLFANARILADLPPETPRLLAWHRQRLMQEAVARWVVGRVG